ncbi:MAG: Fe-S cluster assembly ATPase SufC [Gammaproteobacteria bacterium]|nr:Fe-S cluster assembly ATPase SufC [Gammaproteobacteria bacterium]
MLEIKNLYASLENKPILKGINLSIKPGEVHAIMGPNGSGKSTLASLLAGKNHCDEITGEVLFKGENLLTMSVEARAHAGLFLGFQYPVEIPGVTNIYFLKAALNVKRKAQGLPEVDAMDFIKLVKEKIKQIEMDQGFLYRSVNEGFSGGEKKRNEILQMAVLEPTLAILDEIDSGLDIDALRLVAKGINAFHRNDRSVVLVTHYQRLLDYVKPDYIHVLVNGQIIKSGDHRLALELEDKGYAWVGDKDEISA